MVKKNVIIKDFSAVQEFNRICSHRPYDVDLSQGKYMIDAKSIMGIFSLNLENDLVLLADTDDEAEIETLFKDFIK